MKHGRNRLSRCSRPCRRGGFTLAEALLASTILAITAAAATLPFAAGTQNAQAALELEQAVELGDALMNEILARPLLAPEDPVVRLGPEAGESSRKDYNAIDDFHGLTEQGDALRNYAAIALTGESLDGFWRDVTIQYVSFAEQPASDVNSFVHVQVRVHRDTKLLVTLDRLVSRED